MDEPVKKKAKKTDMRIFPYGEIKVTIKNVIILFKIYLKNIFYVFDIFNPIGTYLMVLPNNAGLVVKFVKFSKKNLLVIILYIQ